jgi:hypothetical protein
MNTVSHRASPTGDQIASRDEIVLAARGTEYSASETKELASPCMLGFFLKKSLTALMTVRSDVLLYCS